MFGRRSDDERPDNVFIQTGRVIVDVHREHARSYGGTCPLEIRSAVRPPRFGFRFGRPVKPRWPNAGIVQWVNRQDAGLAALGQG
jgi:hypothetical protein